MLNYFKIILSTFLISLFCFSFINELNAQLVSDFKVNDDTTSYAQYAAMVGCSDNGNFVIVWYDERLTENPRICGQIYDRNAQRIGDNFQINKDKYQALPSLYVRKDGSFVVAWSVIQTKFRIFNNVGIPVTKEIIIADSTGSITSVDGDSSGNFVITWEQYNSSFVKQIYCQIIDSTGKLIGNKKKVNDDTGNNTHNNPAMTVRQDGSFIITWNDIRPPAMDNADDIYMQMYDRFGNKVGVNEKVNDDLVSTNQQRFSKISSDTANHFVISWSDNRLSFTNSEIYSQLYHSNGIKNGINFRVTQSGTSFGKGICNVVNKPQGDFLVGWSEARPNILKDYFQRYTNTGIRIGNEILVSSEYPSVNKYYSDVKIFEDRIISIWSDARNGPLDIYCNVRSFTNPDTIVKIIQISTLIPERFSLNQNYPNPFNSSTLFTFSINQVNNYNFQIYNFLGQKVYEVFDKTLYPGSYKFDFTSENIASGIYYYILSSPKERLVKSFVLLK